MKTSLILLLAILLACESTKTEYAEFIDFDNFNDHNYLYIEVNIHDENDCGEWGGHEERISLRKDLGEMKLSYHRMDNMCEYTFPNWREKSPVGPTSFTLILNEADIDTIKHYVKGVYEYEPRKDVSSNAADYYEVKYKNGRITKSFDSYDISNDFEGYFNLKAYLLKRVESDK